MVRILAVLFLMLTMPAWAIDTRRVDFRTGTTTDSLVFVTRDAGGNLVLADVHSSATLSQSLAQAASHGALLELDGDDHPQYLNAARHEAAHDDADFNAALAIPADANGNATLGAHVQDAALHPAKDRAESIGGVWDFAAGVSAMEGAAALEPTAGGAPSLRIGAARIVASGASVALEESTLGTARVIGALRGDVGGVRTAELAGFATVEGIAATQLLGGNREASVTAPWTFLRSTRVAVNEDSAELDTSALDAQSSTTLASGVGGSGLRRVAVRGEMLLTANGSASRDGLVAAALEGRAVASGSASAATEGIVAGVLGRATAPVGSLHGAGVAAVAPSGTRRVALLAVLEDDALVAVAELPARPLAGFFGGELLVRGPAGAEELRLESTDPSAGAALTLLVRSVETTATIARGSVVAWRDAAGGRLAVGMAGAMPGEAAVAGIALEEAGAAEEFRIAIGGVAPALVENATIAGEFVHWDGSAMAVGGGSEGVCGVALEGWDGGAGGEIRVLWRPERP